MIKILFLFSTTDGHTKKICAYLQRAIENEMVSVTVTPIEEVISTDLLAFDKIVIGASIRYGKHSKSIYNFIETQRALLAEIPSAFFSVNLVARKPEKDTPETNPYVKKFLPQIPWKPDETAVFAGKVEYKKYGFLDRSMIRMIMWMTKGPTDPKANIEFTNWSKVDSFAKKISTM